MFCTNCGKEVTTKFCSNCGTAVDEPNDMIEFSEPTFNSADVTDSAAAKARFKSRLKQQPSVMDYVKSNKRQEQKNHIKQMDSDGTAYCPKCHSTSLSANKKGFGIGKAVIGGFLAGPIGLVAGNAGAKKVRVTCLKCGHQFMVGHR